MPFDDQLQFVAVFLEKSIQAHAQLSFGKLEEAYAILGTLDGCAHNDTELAMLEPGRSKMLSRNVASVLVAATPETKEVFCSIAVGFCLIGKISSSLLGQVNYSADMFNSSRCDAASLEHIVTRVMDDETTGLYK